MENTIKALTDFQTAYNNLVSVWNEEQPELSKDYPFAQSFDELNINQWVATSLQTLYICTSK